GRAAGACRRARRVAERVPAVSPVAPTTPASPGRGRLVAVAVACALAVRWHALTAIDLGGATWLPEREAVGYITAHHLRGNMLTYFDWGEYAIWHLSPQDRKSTRLNSSH